MLLSGKAGMLPFASILQSLYLIAKVANGVIAPAKCRLVCNDASGLAVQRLGQSPNVGSHNRQAAHLCFHNGDAADLGKFRRRRTRRRIDVHAGAAVSLVKIALVQRAAEIAIRQSINTLVARRIKISHMINRVVVAVDRKLVFMIALEQFGENLVKQYVQAAFGPCGINQLLEVARDRFIRPQRKINAIARDEQLLFVKLHDFLVPRPHELGQHEHVIYIPHAAAKSVSQASRWEIMRPKDVQL